MTDLSGARRSCWKWWVCGLLLFASAVNYMDRQTLANASVRITREFRLSQAEYGRLELVFGWAFAAGSLLFGWLADRAPVRWLYPMVLALWSCAGFLTGWVESYTGLLVCRTMLGFFEAGHWPCGVKTTQRLLEPKDRTMGNSVLQSGTSIGALVTPLLMNLLLTPAPGSWRFIFQGVGALGFLWIGLWLVVVPRGQLGVVCAADNSGAGAVAPTGQEGGFWKVVCSRRFIVVLVVISLINTTFQLIRAWLPKFLMEGRGYDESGALNFNALFYVATDVGCLGAGAATLWLYRRGRSAQGARLVVFAVCAGLAGLSALASVLPKGWPLLAVLLLMGAGALGLFPTYHALTQELSPDHQGKVTGLAGVTAWAIGSPTHVLFGRWVDKTGSFDAGLAMVGALPVLAFLAIWLFWDQKSLHTSPAG